MLDSLDEFSLLSILEEVAIYVDLATIAAASPRLNQLIWDHNFISKFNIKNAHLRIEIEGRGQVPEALYTPVDELSVQELCGGHDNILATLKAFCPAFGQLELALNYMLPHDSDYAVTVVDYVNRYCTAVPQKLIIKWPENPVHEFTAPNVSSVRIEAPEKLTEFSIATYFPQVQELSIRNHDYFTTTEHLPHLKFLELSDENCGHFNFRAFAEKNPQITSVKLDLCEGLDILHEVNELLPNLVSLSYKPKVDIERVMPPRNGESVQLVRFRNVRDYTIDFGWFFRDSQRSDDYFGNFSSIRFEQLEDIKYIAGPDFDIYSQMNFVGQYKEVVSLDFSSFWMSYDEVSYLVNLLPNLRNISIRLKDQPTNHNIFFRLMEETRLDVIRIWMRSQLAEELHGLTLPGQWTSHKEVLRSSYTRTMFYKRNKMS